MATTLSVRTDLAAAQRGLKQLSRDLEGIGTTATAMGRDSDRAVDQLSESLDTAEKQAIEAAEAVQSIGDKEAVAALDSIKEAAKDLASQHSNTATASGAAKKATQELEAQNRRAGEATKQLTETLYDLTRGFGSGGVVGGVQAALPKLTGLVNFLSGPWGAAITVGAGLLAALASELFSVTSETEKANDANDRYAESNEKVNETLEARIQKERQRAKDLAEGSKQVIENIREEIQVQSEVMQNLEQDKKNLNQTLSEASARNLKTLQEIENFSDTWSPFESAQSRIERYNKLVEKAHQNSASLNDLTNRLIDTENALREAQAKRGKLSDELAKAKSSQLKREQKEQEEQAKKEAARKEVLDQGKLQELQKTITIEIDPEKASREQVELNRTERLKQAEELRKTLSMSWEDYGHLVTQINRAYMSELQKLMELQTRKQAEAAEKAAAPQQAGPQKPAAQPARQASPAGNGVDTAARKIADDIEKQVSDARESGEIPRATRQELNQAAEALANRRKAAEFQKQRQELEARQQAEAERRAVKIAEEDPRTAEIQSEKLRQQQERERTRLAEQQKRARQAEEARARRELVQGTVEPKELQAAQESHIKSTLDAAQANGQLNQQVVQALHKTTDLLLQSQQETADLQAKVRHLDKFIQQASSNQRRRAQMGGGR